MAIKLWIEGGETLTLIDDDNEIDNVECLEYLFKGEAFIDKTNGNYNANNMLFGLSHEERLSDYDGNYMLVRNAAWVDAGPLTSFHQWVLGLMNRESPKTLIQIADGYDGAVSYNMWDVLSSEYVGFEEAVDLEINSEGLEFVFRNSFSFYNLFSYIVREIVREYLREHELY